MLFFVICLLIFLFMSRGVSKVTMVTQCRQEVVVDLVTVTKMQQMQAKDHVTHYQDTVITVQGIQKASTVVDAKMATLEQHLGETAQVILIPFILF